MKSLFSIALLVLTLSVSNVQADVIGKGKVYSVIEIEFEGPEQKAKDAPSRDIRFFVEFEHESGAPKHKVHGFYDGDGKGGIEGNVFKARFCPTKPGKWILRFVYSNNETLLHQQHMGDTVLAEPSGLPGFWVVDEDSPGNRWYQRSDGSHQYIIGNTHYSFLSGYEKGGKPSNNNIKEDILGNAKYFKKLRMGLSGDYYPDPNVKPFLDDEGQNTDWGDYSFRPNPKWFHERVDLAVQTAYEKDLITDLILAGPDTEQSRSTLRAKHNNGDPSPFLKYIAARYGSYPNVWICLCNEYEIRKPTYTEEELAHLGMGLNNFLPYPTPLSVHSTPRTLWSDEFQKYPSWNDHQIIQKKIRNLPDAADVIQETWRNSDGDNPLMNPTINDELSYEGKGDKHSEKDTIEAHLGAFLGGGYGTTGEKPGSKLGQYFRGKFNPEEHSSADNLQFLRETIDENITFWKMKPDLSIFDNLDKDFRGMAWPEHEYILGTNKAHNGIIAKLPEGSWKITQYNIIKKTAKKITRNAQGRFKFDSPDSRAVLFHLRRE